MNKFVKVTPFVIAALLLAGCASQDSTESAASTDCTPAGMSTLEPGTLTIATGEPAYSPWVLN
ncbi:MAG: hypothetical protein K9F98_04515, partial [Candidatus Planktophila sp.]|nr:hypothetical protein [Candidatus Planktophila sp.]